MLSKKSLSVGFILTISLAFLIYTFKDIEFAKLLKVLKDTSFKFLLLWIFVFILGTCLRTFRWKVLLASPDSNTPHIRFQDLFHSLNIGNLASMILPFRAGEFVRPYYLCQWTKTSFPRALVSVILERVFDVLGMFTMFYIFVQDTQNIPNIIKVSANGLAFLCAVLVVGMFLARFFPKLVESMIIKVLVIFPKSASDKLHKFSSEIILGLGCIRNLQQLGIIVFLTLGLWVSYAYSFALILAALGEGLDLTIGAVTCVFVGLAIAAPNAPGFLLTFEMGSSAALAVFAYQGEFSLAYALVAHSIQLFCSLLIGLFSLWSKGLSFRSLKPQ